MTRRLFLVMSDTKLLADAYNAALSRADRLLKAITEFERQLDAEWAQQAPRHLRATVVISNLGNSPVILRSVGAMYLYLQGDRPPIVIDMTADSTPTADTTGAFALRGGETKSLVFSSAQPIERHSDYSKVKSLFDGDGLDSDLGLVRVSRDNDDEIIRSGRVTFGRSLQESQWKRLRAGAEQVR